MKINPSDKPMSISAMPVDWLIGYINEQEVRVKRRSKRDTDGVYFQVHLGNWNIPTLLRKEDNDFLLFDRDYADDFSFDTMEQAVAAYELFVRKCASMV